MASCVAACGGSPAKPDAPPEPVLDAFICKAPDLRFQWVGAFSSYASGTVARVGFTGGTGAMVEHRGPTALSPLQLTTTGLTPGTYSWSVLAFTPRLAMEDLHAIAQTGRLAALTQDAGDLIARGHVIASLDVTTDAYALVAMAPASGEPSYSGAGIDASRAELATLAASEGARGRVVTALSGNGSTLHARTSGRTGDTTIYETRVLDATPGTLAAQAAALASDGYIVTAAGRNGDNALIVIGTRPSGGAAARAIKTQNAQGVNVDDGSAIIAWVAGASDLVVLQR